MTSMMESYAFFVPQVSGNILFAALEHCAYTMHIA